MSATPERVEYSTKRVKDEEDSDTEADQRVFGSQVGDNLRYTKGTMAVRFKPGDVTIVVVCPCQECGQLRT